MRLRWWEGWVFAWRMARMLRLSCDLDIHMRMKDQPSCLCRRAADRGLWFGLPLMRFDLEDSVTTDPLSHD